MYNLFLQNKKRLIKSVIKKSSKANMKKRQMQLGLDY